MLSAVRLSVTRVDQTKTVEVMIVQFSPYSRPIPIVFVGWVLPEILSGFLSEGVKQGWGGEN